MTISRRSHIRQLEAESIYVFREAAAQFTRPVLLYSIGKDSSVLLHLAEKAFRPGKIPFSLMHIDTTWKFREMITFRDEMARSKGLDLIVHVNEEGRRNGIDPIVHGSSRYTEIMKTQALRQALDAHGFDAAIGGARRDEEKSRAKERIFSVRSEGHRWDARHQRPELWHTYNGRLERGQTMRIFPLSDWTEFDVWSYIEMEQIPVVPLYFARPRPVVVRDGQLIVVDDDRLRLRPQEQVVTRNVRFRTLGCYPLTAAIESEAASVAEIMQEIASAAGSERQGRLIDADQPGAMEKKKQEGYF